MKTMYEKPDVEYINLMIHDSIMGGFDMSTEIGEDEDEGRE